MDFWGRDWDKDPKEDKWPGKNNAYWEEEEDCERSPRKKKLTPRKFSLEFLSKMQKQTIVAVMLFLVVLAAKYSGDPASGAVLGAFRSALSPANDYSTALNDMAKNVFGGGGGQLVTAVKNGSALAMPLDGTVASGFGWQTSASDQEKRFNNGIYLAAPLGTQVHAPMTGKVTKMGTDPVLGRYVKIDHGSGLTSLIANLGEFGVNAQQTVNKGDSIGTLGFSAALKRPWLYWEVRRNNQPIDPLSLAGKPAKL